MTSTLPERAESKSGGIHMAKVFLESVQQSRWRKAKEKANREPHLTTTSPLNQNPPPNTLKPVKQRTSDTATQTAHPQPTPSPNASSPTISSPSLLQPTTTTKNPPQPHPPPPISTLPRNHSPAITPAVTAASQEPSNAISAASPPNERLSGTNHLASDTDASSAHLRLRGGGPFDIKRIGDDDRVPAGLWFLAGGVGQPPTGKGLRDWKRKDGERREREKVKRAAKKAGGNEGAVPAGEKRKGGFGRLVARLRGGKKVVQPAPGAGGGGGVLGQGPEHEPVPPAPGPGFGGHGPGFGGPGPGFGGPGPHGHGPGHDHHQATATTSSEDDDSDLGTGTAAPH